MANFLTNFGAIAVFLFSSAGYSNSDLIEFEQTSAYGITQQEYKLVGELNTEGPSRIQVIFRADNFAGLREGVLNLPQKCDRYSTNYWNVTETMTSAEFQICDPSEIPKDTILSGTVRNGVFRFVVIKNSNGRFVGTLVGIDSGGAMSVDFNPSKKLIDLN